MSNSNVAADATAGGNSDETVTTAVGATMIALALVAVALRFYTRFHLKTGFGWDDWFILVSLGSLLAAGICVLAASIIDPDAAWLTLAYTDPNYVYTLANQTHLKLSWISSILYYGIVFPAKLSILFMYNRIFSVSLSFRRQVYAVSTLVVLFWIACTFADIFNCWPLKWSWLNSVSPAQYCFNFNLFWFSTGIVEAVFDVVIIALPVNIIRKLQMDVRKRIGLTTVFLLGAFGIVTGVVRIVEAYLPGKRSPSWDNSEVWSSVHGAMGLICACLPVCWPLIIKISFKPMLLKIRDGTSTFRYRWHSREKSWSSTPTFTSRQSHGDLEHGERGHLPGDTEIDLMGVPYKKDGVGVTFPQRAPSSNNSDSTGMVYIIQGGDDTDGRRRVDFAV